MYSNSSNTTFDIDYYCKTHIPLVVKLLGDALKVGSVDSRLAGAVPGEAPAFIATGHMTFNSIEEFQESFGLNADVIMADLLILRIYSRKFN